MAVAGFFICEAMSELQMQAHSRVALWATRGSLILGDSGLFAARLASAKKHVGTLAGTREIESAMCACLGGATALLPVARAASGGDVSDPEPCC